jgi:hypothetical protein
MANNIIIFISIFIKIIAYILLIIELDDTKITYNIPINFVVLQIIALSLLIIISFNKSYLLLLTILIEIGILFSIIFIKIKYDKNKNNITTDDTISAE